MLMVLVAVQESLFDGRLRWQWPLYDELLAMALATGVAVSRWRAGPALDALLPTPRRWLEQSLKPLWWLAPVFVVLLYALRHATRALLGETYPHAPWPAVFGYECLKFAVFYALLPVQCQLVGGLCTFVDALGRSRAPPPTATTASTPADQLRLCNRLALGQLLVRGKSLNADAIPHLPKRCWTVPAGCSTGPSAFALPLTNGPGRQSRTSWCDANCCCGQVLKPAMHGFCFV